MADIAVVVPAYNAERFIEATLLSVLTQGVEHLELIVVDDGSTDGTPQMLEAFASADTRVVVVTQPNRGVSNARNTGLDALSQDKLTVLFLDHDDTLLPNALVDLYNLLCTQPNASAVHGLVSVIGPEGEPAAGDAKELGLNRRRLPVGKGLVWAVKHGPEDVPTAGPTTFDSLVYSSCITSPGQVLMRRSALRDAGKFDPATAPSDDWDLYLRLSRIGPIAFVNRPVLGWRRHDSNASRNIARMKSSSYAVRSKLLSRETRLTSAEIAIVRRQFAYTAAALLNAYRLRQAGCDFKIDVLPAVKLFLRSVATPARR